MTGGLFGVKKKIHKKWSRCSWEVFSMAMLGVLFLSVFAYLPMFGIVLAFKDGDGVLNVMKAIFGTDFVGLANFKEFLLDKDFLDVLKNTVFLNVLQLLINFPAPIIFAILINEVRYKKLKKGLQTITYLPHFLSWVIFGGIVISLINMDTGIINDVLLRLRIIKEPLDIKGDSQYFWGLIIVTSLLKGIGWGSIIYLAAISGIDAQLFEAATIDGANRWHRIIYITLPSIAPSIILFFLLSVSGLLNSGVEHILVFQTQTNLSKSEVIDTFVLKYGLSKGMYSYATAVGVFKSIIALVLLTSSNFICKRITGKGVI